jgi:hypothetical protein
MGFLTRSAFFTHFLSLRLRQTYVQCRPNSKFDDQKISPKLMNAARWNLVHELIRAYNDDGKYVKIF